MLSVRAMVNSKQDACVVTAQGLVWSGLVWSIEMLLPELQIKEE